MLLHELLDVAKLFAPKTTAALEADGRQPVLGYAAIALDMNMRRFGPVR